MSTLLTARRVAEESLRKIGAYSINDAAADGNELAIALTWLDLIMAELSGSATILWLRDSEVQLSLVSGQREYALPTALGADAPANGIQFIIEATLVDEAGNRTPLTMFDLGQYSQVPNKGDTGDPTHVYVERLANPQLFVYPVPDFDSGAGESRMIELTVQTFAEDVDAFRAAGVSARNGEKAHGLRASWQKWAIYELACTLGDGTVRTIDKGKWDRLRDTATISKKALLAFENRQTFDAPTQTAYRDY